MVVEHIWRIPVTDLSIVRFTCEGCKRTSETTAGDAADLLNRGQCPHCAHRFFEMRGNGNAFSHLDQALRCFAQMDGKLKVEFVIPAYGAGKQP